MFFLLFEVGEGEGVLACGWLVGCSAFAFCSSGNIGRCRVVVSYMVLIYIIL